MTKPTKKAENQKKTHTHKAKKKQHKNVAHTDFPEHLPDTAAADVPGEQIPPLEGGWPAERVPADRLRQLRVAAVLPPVPERHDDDGGPDGAEDARSVPAEASSGQCALSV